MSCLALLLYDSSLWLLFNTGARERHLPEPRRTPAESSPPRPGWIRRLALLLPHHPAAKSFQMEVLLSVGPLGAGAPGRAHNSVTLEEPACQGAGSPPPLPVCPHTCPSGSSPSPQCRARLTGTRYLLEQERTNESASDCGVSFLLCKTAGARGVRTWQTLIPRPLSGHKSRAKLQAQTSSSQPCSDISPLPLCALEPVKRSSEGRIALQPEQVDTRVPTVLPLPPAVIVFSEVR